MFYIWRALSCNVTLIAQGKEYDSGICGHVGGTGKMKQYIGYGRCLSRNLCLGQSSLTSSYVCPSDHSVIGILEWGS